MGQIQTQRCQKLQIKPVESATSCKTFQYASLLKPAFRPERAQKGLEAWCVNVPKYLADTGRRRQFFYEVREAFRERRSA